MFKFGQKKGLKEFDRVPPCPKPSNDCLGIRTGAVVIAVDGGTEAEGLPRNPERCV